VGHKSKTSGNIKMTKQQAGQIGGLQTFLRYGRSHMSRIGRNGGRPRALTINQLGQQLALEAQNKIEGGRLQTAANRPTSLTRLRELWRLRKMELGGAS